MTTISATTPERTGGQSPAAPEFHVKIRPTRGFATLDFSAVWEFRDLLYFLVWRDVKVRYQQTVLGVAWAILQPLLTTIVFTVIFGQYAKMPSEGFPPSVFIFAAMLPWTYFSAAINRSGTSLVGDANLVRKVYFPRLLIPLAAVAAPLVDFFVSSWVLFAMLAWNDIPLRWNVVALPFFLLLALATALGVGLWLSALNARYRDVGHTLPFLVQLWFFASPIVYPLSMFPEDWRWLYGLNPLVGVIEGFRWSLLGTQHVDAAVMTSGIIVVLILLSSGAVFFKRTERTLADVL